MSLPKTRLNHGGNEPITESALFNSLKWIFGPAVRSAWLGKVTGLENLPKTGPAIIASNHASYLDFLLLSAVSPRQPKFIAGEVFYNNFILRKSFESMGYIRIDRGAGSVSAMRKAVRKLELGDIVAIFPEGRRSGDGVLQKGRSGVGFLAVETGAPIIPIFIDGTLHAWSRHKRIPTLHKCSIRIGEPICFGKHSDKEQRKEHIHAVTHGVMQAIARLGNVKYPW